MKRWFGRFISNLYWKYGRKHDDNTFWARVVVHHIPKGLDGKVLISELNRISGDLEMRAEVHTSPVGTPEWEPGTKPPFKK